MVSDAAQANVNAIAPLHPREKVETEIASVVDGEWFSKLRSSRKKMQQRWWVSMLSRK
jgi:hypothetical protein